MMTTTATPAADGRSRLLRLSESAERSVSVLALSLMTVLPITEVVTRLMRRPGIPGSTVFVQHLTLWVAFLGAMLAVKSDRLLSLSANTFLREKWAARVRLITSGFTAGICFSLAWASLQMVRAEREGGGILAAGVPRWVAQLIMPVGFLVVAARLVWGASERTTGRLVAALGLVAAAGFYFLQQPSGPTLIYAGVGAIVVTALLGLPIFAMLGGIAVLLFWYSGVPINAVPVAAYDLVSSEVLPSLPLFTFAGYLLVEGGASHRLLRAYSALFGWLPGGLAVTTVLMCPVFAWAGSGMTILALGGLLLPMFLEARYRENFSIGLINASGSVGLLFPPSLPVILFGIYSGTPIDTLFIGSFLPGMLLVILVCVYSVVQGVRSGVTRQAFSGREAVRAVWAAKWELALPILVLYGMFGGFSNLTEAGAITALYAFVVECLIYRGISLRRDYPRVVIECVTLMGGVLLIIGMAKGFTNYLVDAQVPNWLSELVRAHVHSKYLFLFLLNIFLLLKGSFMDVFSAIIVLVPLLTQPFGSSIAEAFGIDKVQLGIIFLANLELGYLTPPVGINLCLAAYRFRKSMTSVYRATLPFYAILLAGVLAVTYIP